MSDKAPLVSVVMPVYNGEQFLNESIVSILIQTFADFEFIIIDDGSTDNSLDIIREFASKDSRIRIVANNTNLGISESLNKGIDLAQGDYIARMDADDISLKDRFAKQVVYLHDNTDIAVLGGNLIKIDCNGNEIFHSNYSLTPGKIRWGLFFCHQIAHPTVMMRKELFAIKGYRYKALPYCEDYDLWLEICKDFHLANLEDVLIYYRMHESSISTNHHGEQKKLVHELLLPKIQRTTSKRITQMQVAGMQNISSIKTTKDALIIINTICHLKKNALQWSVNQEDKKYIRKNASERIKSIIRNQLQKNTKFLP